MAIIMSLSALLASLAQLAVVQLAQLEEMSNYHSLFHSSANEKFNEIK